MIRRTLVGIALIIATSVGFAAPASAHVGSSVCEASDPPQYDHYLIVHAHQISTSNQWGCFSWNRVNGSGRRECFWQADQFGVNGFYSCGHDIW